MEIKSLLTIISIIFVFSSGHSGDGVDFCQSFLANNNSIDYGYQYKSDGFYFFIDSSYWRIGFDVLSKTFTIPIKSFQNIKLFDKSYAFVFTNRICHDSICRTNYWRTGLYRDLTIVWKEVFIDAFGHLNVSVHYGSHINNLQLIQDIEPMLAFHLISDPYLCFLQQKQSMNGTVPLFNRVYRCYRIDKPVIRIAIENVYASKYLNQTDNVIINLMNQMNTDGIPYGSKETILNNIEDSRKVVAIFDVKDHYVFFHTEDNKITYCFSNGILFNKGCTGVTKILIDCSNYLQTTSDISLISNPKVESISESTKILIILGLIMLVIMTVILIIVWKLIPPVKVKNKAIEKGKPVEQPIRQPSIKLADYDE